MKGQTTLFSKNTDDWQTPQELYNELNKEFKFTFDPCPYQSPFNGLNVDWGQSNFINPPYSKVLAFAKKGYEEYLKGKTCVWLVFARTDTKWFHDYIYPYAELRFIKGRLKFSGSKNSAPAPSMIAILKNRYLYI